MKPGPGGTVVKVDVEVLVDEVGDPRRFGAVVVPAVLYAAWVERCETNSATRPPVITSAMSAMAITRPVWRVEARCAWRISARVFGAGASSLTNSIVARADGALRARRSFTTCMRDFRSA